ncbi:MAG TPA: class I SAM-dependent methyltransferase [Candidatus Bathyarchaeia archaeon]|nr:class I SAM-dependent methyltransferase [Candidatus Bathyarchaeia archaeon]
MKKKVEQLLMKLYGGQATLHLDLYQLSNQHRRKHGQDCDMFPSDPLQAPLWSVLASLTNARRMLEVGCGHGYTAAIMATAAGPESHLDTIEGDPTHTELAEQVFEQRGFAKQIKVLRGRGEDILPKLKHHYDIIFLDGDWREYPGYIPHLRRITRPGSVIVTANLNPLFGGWGSGLSGKRAIQSYLTQLIRDPHFHTYIVPGEWHSISVRV